MRHIILVIIVTLTVVNIIMAALAMRDIRDNDPPSTDLIVLTSLLIFVLMLAYLFMPQ